MGSEQSDRPPVWAFVLAFAAVYLAYGLNYLAIKEGVKTLPPFLFAGAHVTLAGLLVFAWLLLRGETVRLPWHGVRWAALGGSIVFIGGTGLVTMAEATGEINTGLAAVLRATTPVWVALLEWLRPKGERLGGWAWLGLLLAIGGVLLLVIPKLEAGHSLTDDLGPLLVIASALSWAVGSIVLRHHRPCTSTLLASAYQMAIGGLGMVALGLALGEGREFRPAELTRDAIVGFLFLLFIHTLVGYSALNWLLRHVSATLATTKFCVSPAVALLAGCLVLNEQLTGPILAGTLLILLGVALAMWKQ
jgi:drug/metabolite transporter (DMT)-like permease